MPFDFDEYKMYTIDYDLLFDNIFKLPFLNNLQWKEIYLLQWKGILQECDLASIEHFNTPEKIQKYQQAVAAENEGLIFKKSFTFQPSQIEVFFNFRISIIFKILNDSNQNVNSTKISLNKFNSSHPEIHWDPRTIDKSAKFNNYPIFIVPFFDKDSNGLVIDGNHRVTHAIQLRKKYIDCFFFSEKNVVDLNLFCSAFDKMLYIFFNEINHFFINKTYKNSTDLELLNKSYLSGNGIQF